ncbi:E3 ubiquitin-protein ligase APD1-4 middle domain-containing protein [Camponotus japonicus]
MHGIRRVLVFCILVAVLPITLIAIPLYLRHIIYADVAYAVTESDIMEINDGISTIFCSEHTLQMNGTFNAFQMTQRPEITSKRKHLRLKKSMSLPDDTLEYWGFYLLKGATVTLSVCSRFPGASILVVKGERNLHTCGLLEHNINKEQTPDIYLPGANKQVKIIYESNAQEINSKEPTMVEPLNILTTNIHTPNVSSENPMDGNEKVLIKYNNNTNNNTLSHKLDENLKDIDILYNTAASYIKKHIDDQQESINSTRTLRHLRRKMRKNKKKKMRQDKKYTQDQDRELHIQKLKQELHSDKIDEKEMVGQEIKNEMGIKRFKRDRELIKPPSLLDQGIRHGGNANKNFTSSSNEGSSISSFESSLFNCYGGAILLTHEFEPSNQCTNISYLLSSKHAQANHHVEEDGYYYYIFYSDNDIVSNDIYTIFDIYKPTFQYENVSKSCINATECSFSLNPLSADRIIVEIPTKDGIEHNEIDDTNILISICQPRMGAYMFFPIAMLVSVLACAFI